MLTARIPVDEGAKVLNGKMRRKVRCVDDFTASSINLGVAVGETMHHDTLDILVSMVQSLILEGRAVHFRKDDFVAAFKTLPLGQEDLPLAVALWLDSLGSVRALQLHACPFGALASVHAWHRFGAAVQLILAKLFLIAYARYVDDLFSADVILPHDFQHEAANVLVGPAGTAYLARWVVENLLGWQLDKDKAVADVQMCSRRRRAVLL